MYNPEQTKQHLLDILDKLDVMVLDSLPLDSYHFHIKLHLTISDIDVSILQKQGNEHRVEVYSQVLMNEDDKVKLRIATDLELLELILEIRQFLFSNGMYAKFFFDGENDYDDSGILLSSPLYTKSLSVEELDRALEQIEAAVEVVMGILHKHLF